MQRKKKVAKKKAAKAKAPARKKSATAKAGKSSKKKAATKKAAKSTVKKEAATKKAALKKTTKKKTPAKKTAAKKPTKKKAAAKTVAKKKTAVKPAKRSSVSTPSAKKTPAAKPAPAKQAVRAIPGWTTQAAPRLQSSRKPVSPRYFFKNDIPKSYNETYFNAIVRDAQSIFVYWELSDELQESVKKAMGDKAYEASKRILRVLDVTDIEYDGTNAWSSFDIDISPTANNWYINVSQPARNYVIECGQRDKSGQFYLLIRSNTIIMPRAAISGAIDAASGANESALLQASGTQQTPPGSSEIQQSASTLFAGSSENSSSL